MKYRKKPVVVDALQWDGTNFDEICNFMQKFYGSKLNYENMSEHASKTGELFIQSLEGVMRASKGDYIIKGIQGEFYPCKPDIFEVTYEKID